jgi:sugar phosphate permease
LNGATRAARRSTFWTLLFGYGGYYLCRANLGVAAPLLQNELHLDKVQIGAITGIATLAYAGGKFANGPLGDLLGGRRVFLLGMTGAILCNLAFGLSTSLTVFVVVWSLNRFVQSAGWMGLVQLVSQWYERHEYGVVMALLSLSFLVGDVAARGYGAAILAVGFGWRALFLIPAITLAAFAVVAVFTLQAPAKPATERSTPSADDVPDGTAAVAGRLKEIFLVLVMSSGFWMACVLSFLLTFLRTVFLDWTVLYLVDAGTANWKAALQSAMFPATGAAGTLFAGWYTDRISRGRRGPIAAGMLGMLVLSLIALAFFSAASPTLSIACIGAAGFFLLGPYSMLGGCLALDYGGTRAASTAAGVTDGIGYVGASASGLVLGGVVQNHGWKTAFVVLAATAAVAFLAAIAFSFIAETSRTERRRETREAA